MAYVDGFLIALPKQNVEAYKDLARKAGEVWKEHGALNYVECLGDDVPYGELTSFPRAVQAKEDETVVFSWVAYRSREDRDVIVAKVMTDPRLQGDEWKSIFDGKRMIYGGFQAFLEL
ncbi:MULTISPECIES: DUF1428 domain-containing protein [Sinorhizobium]|uniref:RNA signal recognition particle n=2 Tax=Sinorhizobium TaxID=28105 RepID=A0A2S3YML5_9HYPH|nr:MULTISPECIES: DUF1428 family protein [Sinorhizobium]ASY57308.1 protein of unknown function DUF1428 [Sinorhizobium sp. CCBAU 05631]AUX77088.1 hypothetical protein NXT3_CH02527 [Sinorhizobium fredii]PDT42358.1 DUF1428 domain-containing protein [Sinorhizobium sp. FG01]POH30276.1 RNA signal recognition particle [Sinorhizobium americanum]